MPETHEKDNSDKHIEVGKGKLGISIRNENEELNGLPKNKEMNNSGLEAVSGTVIRTDKVLELQQMVELYKNGAESVLKIASSEMTTRWGNRTTITIAGELIFLGINKLFNICLGVPKEGASVEMLEVFKSLSEQLDAVESNAVRSTGIGLPEDRNACYRVHDAIKMLEKGFARTSK